LEKELEVNQLIAIIADRVPTIVAVTGLNAHQRFLELFFNNIRNPHTRRAYARAVNEF
jgi:hypothetical protein